MLSVLYIFSSFTLYSNPVTRYTSYPIEAQILNNLTKVIAIKFQGFESFRI